MSSTKPRRQVNMKPLTVILLSLVLSAMTAAGVLAADMMSAVTSEKTEAGYIHSFSKYSFASNAARNSAVAEPVRITVGTGYTVLDIDGGSLSKYARASGADTVYTFSQAGSYSVKVFAPKNNAGDREYGLFSFTVQSAASTVSSAVSVTSADPIRTTMHDSGASYITDIVDGRTYYGSVSVALAGGMSATLARDGGPGAPYESNTLISSPGSYVMTFSSTNRTGAVEQSTLSFKVGPNSNPLPLSASNDYLDYVNSNPVNDRIETATGSTVVGTDAAAQSSSGTASGAPSASSAQSAASSQAASSPAAGTEAQAWGTPPGTAPATQWSDPSAQWYDPTVDPSAQWSTEPGSSSSPTDTPGSDLYDPTSQWGSGWDYSPTGWDYSSPGWDYSASGWDYSQEPTDRSVTVTIADTYFPDFDIYEHSFAMGKYFYANIKNGAITAQGVMFDFPAGIHVSMRKDGVSVPFANQATLLSEGAYLLRLSATDDSTEPPTEYKGVFRFRIQGFDTFLTDGRGTVIAPDSIFPVEETPEETAEEAPEPVPEPESGPATLADPSEYGSLSQSYSAEARVFKLTASNGKGFTASVPNGMITNAPVSLGFVGSDTLLAAVYKDDALFTYAGGRITEPGIYRFLTTTGQQFGFRIVNEPTRSIRMYYAPFGFRITRATVNGRAVRVAESRMMCSGDGDYTVELSSVEGADLQTAFSIGEYTEPEPEADVIREADPEKPERAPRPEANPLRTVILIALLAALAVASGILYYFDKVKA